MLINRLEKLVFGEITGDEMPPHAVTAALGLIRKELGDKATVEHTGDGLRPFALIPEQMQDVSAWSEQFSPKAKTEH